MLLSYTDSAYLNMRFITAAAIVAAVTGTVDATFMETDILAAAGLAKLGLHVALNGYPNPEKCTLENVAVRREWYVADGVSVDKAEIV